MISLLKKTVLAAALAASALAGSAPAMADGYHGGGYYHGGGGGAGTAVAAGIFGLAVGAIIATSIHHDDRNDAEGGYYVDRRWAWHDGYYWDQNGYRFARDGRPCGHDDRGYARRGYSENGYYRGDPNQGYYGQGYYGRDGYHGDPREYEGGPGY